MAADQKKTTNEPDFEPLRPISLRNDQPARTADDAGDLLNFRPLARTVAEIAVGTEGPFTIGITAKWGSGKTSMLHMVRDLIERHGRTKGKEWQATHVHVWFNAWQYEREEEPIVPLLLQIQREIRKVEAEHSSAFENATGTVKGWLYGLWCILFSAVYGAKIKIPAGSPLSAFEFDLSKVVDKYEKETEPEPETKLPISSLQEAIDQLNQISEAREKELDEIPIEDRPKIFVYVDDLDRCHPDAALRLLDGIKLILNQPGFVFLLALDKTTLEDHLVKKYHDDYGASNAPEAGQRYVDKIVQLEIPLPPSHGHFAGGSEDEKLDPNYVGKGYVERVAQEILPPEIAWPVAQVFAPCRFLSPRDVVRLLLRLRVDWTMWKSKGKPKIQRKAEEQSFKGRGGGSDSEEDVYFLNDREVVSAMVLARLLEHVFPSSRRQDYLDLVDGPRLCSLVAAEAGLKTLPSEESTTLDREVLRLVTGPRGLVEAVKSFGAEWLENQSLRVQLFEFLNPGATETGIDLSQFELVAKAVRQSLGLREGEVTSRDWGRVTKLALSFEATNEALRWVARCKKLESLIISDTQVSDVSPLSGLPALTSLNLSGTQVSDVSPLSDLKALNLLALSGTRVSDVSPLSGLPALTSLYLHNTQVASVSRLSALTSLKWLDLSSTHVSDISPLSNLKALCELHLSGTQVSDVSPLARLTALTSVSLSGTQVSTVSPLSRLKALMWLDLSGTQVSDVSPLSGLTALISLDLSGTRVSNIAPLSDLTELNRLILSGTHVSARQVADLQRKLSRCSITRSGRVFS